MTTWGLVATIKAPPAETLAFAAWHLEQGARRLFIYLDDANAQAADHLAAHPGCRVTLTDDAWWAKRGRRPEKHQVRQSRNATHAYRRAGDVDWLAHIDVDEFLIPSRPVAGVLGDLAQDILCARVRPIEALADGDGTAFKGFIPAGPHRLPLVQALYPTYGRHIRGGFVSHLAGKVFVRTGHDRMKLRIHNVFLDEAMNPGETELPQIELAHVHAKGWEKFIGSFRFRLQHGSYRAGLEPGKQSGQMMHEMLARLDAEQGEAGLRDFFDEVIADTPRPRDALSAQGLLRRVDLPLDALRQKHFPDFEADC